MKKVLLATTALISAGVLAGGDVAAQDKPISLVLGGYYRAAFSMNNDDNGAGERGAGAGTTATPGRRSDRIAQDVEVHFKGEVTLSRGLTVGAVIEMEAQEQNGDQIDETWAYIKGRWGELRYGDEDSVTRLMALSSPYPLNDTQFGVNSPFFTHNNSGVGAFSKGAGDVITQTGPAGPGTNTTSADLSTDSTKILYFTPRISGFQLGVSYAPDGTQDCRGSNAATNGCGAGVGVGRANNNGLSNIWAIGGNYDGKVGSVDLKGMLGYSEAKAEIPGGTNRDPNTFLAGLNIGYMGWWLGGSFQKTKDGNQFADTGIDGREATVFDIGIAYNPGPWGVSLAWSRGKYDRGSGAAGTGATSVEDTMDVYALTGAYLLGPGIRVNAGLEHVKYDPSVGGDYSSTAFLIGTTFIF